MPEPETFDPTAGVELLMRLIPNCSVFMADAVAVGVMASMLLPPDVSVDPVITIEYPEEALVDAVIEDVPEPVALVDKVPRATVADASVKLNVSSTLAVTVIAPAVELATVPVSIGVVQVASE